VGDFVAARTSEINKADSSADAPTGISKTCQYDGCMCSKDLPATGNVHVRRQCLKTKFSPQGINEACPCATKSIRIGGPS
jgi:hypothetical protein